jgi:hypothetical protein
MRWGNNYVWRHDKYREVCGHGHSSIHLKWLRKAAMKWRIGSKTLCHLYRDFHGYINWLNIQVYIACLSAGKTWLFLHSPATFLCTFQHVCLSSAFSIWNEQHYIIITAKIHQKIYRISFKASMHIWLLWKCYSSCLFV